MSTRDELRKSLDRTWKEGSAELRDQLLLDPEFWNATVQFIKLLTAPGSSLVRGVDEAEIEGQAIANAFQGLPAFRGESVYSTWVERIVRNLASTAYTRGQRTETRDFQDESAAPIDANIRPDDEHKMLVRGIAGAELMAQLTPLEAEIESLLCEYGSDEVAQLLGLPSGSAVRTARHRMIKRLQQVVDQRPSVGKEVGAGVRKLRKSG